MVYDNSRFIKFNIIAEISPVALLLMLLFEIFIPVSDEVFCNAFPILRTPDVPKLLVPM